MSLGPPEYHELSNAQSYILINSIIWCAVEVSLS